MGRAKQSNDEAAEQSAGQKRTRVTLGIQTTTPATGPPKEKAHPALRKLEREKDAREQAERLLEEKSLELYQANAQLRELNTDLEMKICEIAQYTERARHAAYHDEVTGIPNRRAITDHLEVVFDLNFSVLFFDIDHFKQINDTLGHAAGDFVLKSVGERLRALCDLDVFFGRFGGDEFVVVVPEHVEKGRGAALAKTILAEVPKRTFHEGNPINFGLSIGMSHSNPAHARSEEVLLEADLALYRAKSNGRACIVQFTDAMRAEAERRRILSDQIFEALKNGEFKPFYMPRVCAKTGKTMCIEALARWNSPKLGLVSPLDFLGVAEDIGQVEQIDRQILEYALEDFRSFERDRLEIPKFSVNVSSRRMMNDGLLDEIRALSFRRRAISFELLESVFLDDAGVEVEMRLKNLRDLGIGIEIDDFGSGHASINGLLSVRPDTLKIDKQLVIDALENSSHVELLSSIVSIGHALGIAVVAEGVETQEHVALCQRIGCDQLQGWAIARPMPAPELRAWQENRSKAVDSAD